MGKTKKRSKILLLSAALAATTWFPGAAMAEDNITLDFRDTDIRQIIKVIAQQSGTNIIAEKSVRGQVTVKMSDVYYEEAMNLIAKTNGFAVRKIGNTWILADEKKLVDAFEKGLTITKRLQYAKASDVSKVISSTIRKDIRVATDDRINAVIVSGSKELLDEVKKLIETIDTPVHQVMIEAKVVEVSTTATKNIGFKWSGYTESEQTHSSDSDSGGSYPLFTTKEYFAQNPDSGLYQNTFSGQQGKLFGLGDFYRENMLFKATFTALEKRNENKVLSNPKISAVNGQEANINVGSKVIYPGGADQPPKEKDTGIKLKIIPRINDDGYITVDAEPEVSFVKEWSNNGMYPVIDSRAAKTTVRVRDGEEILIGGLIRDEETKSNSKVPLLGNIPIIKSLFSYKGKTGNSQELIILITPHIIAQSIESAAPTSLVPETNMAPVGNYSAAPVGQPAGTIDDSFDNAFDTSF
jgi:type IV pilus assembly protein PilQ